MAGNAGPTGARPGRPVTAPRAGDGIAYTSDFLSGTSDCSLAREVRSTLHLSREHAPDVCSSSIVKEEREKPETPPLRDRGCLMQQRTTEHDSAASRRLERRAGKLRKAQRASLIIISIQEYSGWGHYTKVRFMYAKAKQMLNQGLTKRVVWSGVPAKAEIFALAGCGKTSYPAISDRDSLIFREDAIGGGRCGAKIGRRRACSRT
jgi:hypothetical protein